MNEGAPLCLDEGNDYGNISQSRSHDVWKYYCGRASHIGHGRTMNQKRESERRYADHTAIARHTREPRLHCLGP